MDFVGISFGTLNSTVAVIGKNSNGEIIANEDGDRIIPSYVAFTGYEKLVGSQAKVQAISNPKGTIVQFRNILGLRFDDQIVQKQLSTLQMSIIDHEGYPSYEYDEYANEDAQDPVSKTTSVEAVTTLFLKKLKDTAESYSGKIILGAVISVPPFSDEKSCEALVKCAKDAGFQKVVTISEPVAAALAFDRNASIKDDIKVSSKIDRKILVCDLGGHQFNVSLLSSNKGLYSLIDSKTDEHLGGIEFDKLLVEYVKEEFRKKTKLEVGKNRRANAKLLSACEQTKRMLSQKDTAPISVESLYEGVDFHSQVIRGRFENLAEPLIQRCIGLIKSLLGSVHETIDHIDEVLLVGGSTRIPRFQSAVRDVFPESTVIRNDVEPDEAIGNGAATQAAIIKSFEEDSGLDFIETVNKKEVTELAHLNHSVGIELADGTLGIIIPKLTPIPVRREVQFSNAIKGQKEVYICVYEGEEKIAKKNGKLAEIVLSDLPAGLEAGEAKISITLVIEKDEFLQVIAQEKTSGKKKVGNDFLCPVTYQNPLPPIPFEPKLFGGESISRHYETVPNSKTPFYIPPVSFHPLASSLNLMSRSDVSNATLDPEDAPLLLPYAPPAAPTATKKQRPVASWLRRTEFMSVEKKTPKKVVQEQEVITQSIESTFIAASQAILSNLKHPTKPELKAIELLPIFPDFERFPYKYKSVILDHNPLSNDPNDSDAKLKNSILVKAETGYAMYSPTNETMSRIMALEEDEDDIGHEYEYEHIRDFDEKPQPYENVTLYINVTDEAAMYHVIDERIQLQRKRMQGEEHCDYVIKKRKPNNEEILVQQERMKEILPFEVESEKRGDYYEKRGDDYEKRGDDYEKRGDDYEKRGDDSDGDVQW